MTAAVDAYFRFLKVLIALLLLGMVILVFGNVFLRYAFNSGITVSEELSRWFFVWMVFLGAIIGVREHGHLGVDTVVKLLPPWGRKLCFIVSYVLMLYVTLLLIQGSWEQTIINWSVTAPASGLSAGLVYGVGIIFGVSVAVILAYELYRALTGAMRPDEFIAVKESEEI